MDAPEGEQLARLEPVFLNRPLQDMLDIETLEVSPGEGREPRLAAALPWGGAQRAACGARKVVSAADYLQCNRP
jgi:hypothetical protein